MKMATTGAGPGFGLGGFASQLVILFEDGATLERFLADGLDATAGVGDMAGDEKEQLGLSFDGGKAVFVLTGKGWKVAARLTGSRYWPDEARSTSADRDVPTDRYPDPIGPPRLWGGVD